jgi:rhamnulokinase
MGNLLVQAMGRGRISDLADLRAVVARSFPVTVYEPRDTAAWDDAAGRFMQLVR